MIKFILMFLAVQNTYTIELSKIVAAECSICPSEEQMQVSHTIINRIASTEYPNTLVGVINQPGQYTTPVENLKGLESVYLNIKIYKQIFGNFKNTSYFCLETTNNKDFLEFVKEGGFKMKYHWFR